MLTFSYWDIRGIGQPLRFLLSYLQIEYKEKLYLCSQKEEWFNKDKNELDIPMINLPYLIDGEYRLTESYAIALYLVKKYKRVDLWGQNIDGTFNPREIIVEQLFGVLRDLTQEMMKLVFHPNFKTEKDAIFQQTISPIFKKLIAFLGDKQFLADTLSFADFVFYELLCSSMHLFPEIKTHTLQEYKKRFENLEGIKQYIETAQIDLNIFYPLGIAQWSGPQ